MEAATGNCLPLPAEIRDRVYEFALAVSDDDSLDVNNCYISYQTILPGFSVRRWGPTPLDLSLLLVSKQTCQEAYGIFYRINQFDFGGTAELCMFLRKIGPRRRCSITCVKFGFGPEAVFETIELLRTCECLEYLKVHISNMVESGHLNALCTLRGIKKVEIVMSPYPYPRSIGPICYCDGPRFDIKEVEQLISGPRS